MKKLFSVLVAVIVALGFGLVFTSGASATNWDPWAVGTGSTVVDGLGNITFTAGSSTSPVWTNGQMGNKAFYSTDDFNGMKVGDLIELRYTLVSPADPTGLSAPYLNIVVTDGTDFSFLLLDAMPIPDGQQRHVFSTAQYRGGEGTGSLAAWNNVWKSFDDVKNLTIAAGFSANTTAVAPVSPGWTGPGADDGIVLVWGNRGGAANYENPVTIKDVSVAVPEPGILILLGISMMSVAGLRRWWKE